MEEKKRKNIRRKFCWYDCVAIVTTACAIVLFIISRAVAQEYEWCSNLLMSIGASGLLGAVLTYIFAWINGRSTIIEMANREINEVYKFFAFVMNVFPSLSKSSQNNDELKEIVLNRPYFYALNKMYPIYTKECYAFVESLTRSIENGNSDKIFKDFFEIMNRTRIIQELFDQEYLDSEKRPITRNGDPIKDYGALYSARKRKFKEE